MRLRMLLASAVAVFMVAAGWSANAHYFKGCTHVPAVTGTGNGVVYIDDRPLVWIYAETNNHEGYQSGGTSIIDETDIDGCYNHDCRTGISACPKVASDTLIL